VDGHVVGFGALDDVLRFLFGSMPLVALKMCSFAQAGS